MAQKELLDSLKSGNLKQAYLLYGEERYLVNHYAGEISNAVLKSGEELYSRNIFDETTAVSEIIMTAETLPFFTERRLIVIKGSRLFTSGRKDDSEKMANYLPSIAETTVIIFIETDIDRRNKLYKQISKVGLVLDCETPKQDVLATWLMRQSKKSNKVMPSIVAQHFVRVAGTNMQSLDNELAKLMAYCDTNEDITKQDIDAICTPTLESRIFDLVKAMCSGRTGEALRLYNIMLALKESPFTVLSMVIRQFRIVLLSICAKEKGMTIYDTAKALNLRDFMVQEALGQGRNFTVSSLLARLEYCLETDVKIKTGLLSPEMGVEMLIVKYSHLTQ